MTPYLLLAYLHVIFTILFVGYALFWVIMGLAIAREETPAETSRLLGVINAGRWPPGGVPYALRLPFPALGWGFLAALALTGIPLLSYHRQMPNPSVLNAKLALFGLLLLGQAVASRRPQRSLAFLNGALALAIVVLSALLRR